MNILTGGLTRLLAFGYLLKFTLLFFIRESNHRFFITGEY